MDKALKRKVVLVTGAGRGIGAATARHLAELGAVVAVNDLDRDAAEQTVDQIMADGGAATAAPFDVTDWAAVAEAFDRVVAEHGRLDGLVNNAAIYRMADVADSTPELWESTLRVNVVGVAACGQQAARQMVRQRSGSIVNIVSGAQCGMDAMSVYGASKGAVASLTYGWAAELGKDGIRVNAVSPRGATRMAEHGSRFIRRRTGADVPPEPDPSVNAPAIAYLLSDRAEGVTGQVLRVDGTDLSLMTHPAVTLPMLRAQEWDVSTVSAAFDDHLAARRHPVGVTGVPFVAPVAPGSPQWSVAADGESTVLPQPVRWST